MRHRDGLQVTCCASTACCCCQGHSQNAPQFPLAPSTLLHWPACAIAIMVWSHKSPGDSRLRHIHEAKVDS